MKPKTKRFLTLFFVAFFLTVALSLPALAGSNYSLMKRFGGRCGIICTQPKTEIGSYKNRADCNTAKGKAKKAQKEAIAEAEENGTEVPRKDHFWCEKN